MKKLLLFILFAAGSMPLTYATTCPGATAVPDFPTMPYTQTLVCGASNDINSGNATVCGSSFYSGGQEALYVWTPSASYTNVTIAYNGVSWTGIMLYAGCPTSGGTCIGNITSSATSKTLTVAGTINAGTTYYIMFDTWPTPNSPCPGTFTLNGTPNLPAAPPTPNQDPATPTCTSGSMITVPGTFNLHTNWFWQTNATDISFAIPYAGPYTVFGNGTYYIRTYDSTNTQWSASSSSISISNFPILTSPPAAVAAQNPACLSTSISVAAAPTDYNYYWQGINTNGTDNSQDASTPYVVSTTGTYYVTSYQISTGCWSSGTGTTVTVSSYVPAAPTSAFTSYTICNGTTSQLISATPAPGGSGGSINQSFGTSLVSTGSGAAQFDITIPAIPADATIMSAQLQLTNVNSINGSWRSEIRVALSGVYALNPTQISTQSSGGLISPDMTLNLSNFTSTGGTLSLLLTESYDDFGVDDASFGEVKLIITYTQNPVSTLTWYTDPAAGSVLGTTSSIDAVGTSVLSNTSPAGAYMFYAASNSAACESSTRLEVTVNVTQVVAVMSNSAITCNGANDGTASVAATGGNGTLSYDWTPNNPTGDGTDMITGLNVNSYAVTVTDINNCSATGMTSITEPSVITVTPALQTNVTCNGGSNGTASVTATGGTGTLSYAWTSSPTGDGTGAVSGLRANPYTVTVTDNNSCTGTSSFTITEPAPTVNVMVATSGNTITANATGASYQWLDCNGSTVLSGQTNQSFFASVSGNFSVIVTELGCSDTSACESVSVISTAVLATISENAFGLYPNPASAGITLQLSMDLLEDAKTVSVYNSLGLLVHSEQIVSALTNINLEGLAKGSYLVKLRTAQGDLFRKIIKE